LTSLNATTSGLFITPLRATSQTNPLFYNALNNELTYYTSSQADKTNIVNLPDGLSNNLYCLQPRQFTYIPDGTTNNGFIAEEVGLVDKNLVVLDTSSNPVNIKWFDIITYLVSEIQKHQEVFNEISSNLTQAQNNIVELDNLLQISQAQLQISQGQLQTLFTSQSQLQTTQTQLQTTQTQLQTQVQTTQTQLQTQLQTQVQTQSQAVVGKIIPLKQFNFNDLLTKSPFA
jgi:hypothetical protein